MTRPLSYILDLLGIHQVKSSGVSVPISKTLNFLGGAATYNASTGEIDIAVGEAESIAYDNAGTNVTATDVQAAITELDTRDTLGANEIAGRSATGGTLSGIAIGENQIAGRETGGNVSGTSPNAFTFTDATASGGNPTNKAGADDAQPISAIANSGSDTFDFDPGVSGYYQGTFVAIVKRTGFSTYRKIGYVQDFYRDGGGVIHLVGDPVQLPGGDDTGLAMAFSISFDDLRVTLTNSAGWEVSGYLWAGWVRGDLI